jgi:hypothetical protein
MQVSRYALDFETFALSELQTLRYEGTGTFEKMLHFSPSTTLTAHDIQDRRRCPKLGPVHRHRQPRDRIALQSSHMYGAPFEFSGT